MSLTLEMSFPHESSTKGTPRKTSVLNTRDVVTVSLQVKVP